MGPTHKTNGFPESYRILPRQALGSGITSTVSHMFTGIVEHLGVISSLTPLDTSSSGGNGFSATITDVGPILEDVHLGDSISINGTCLTVTEYDGTTSFKVGIAPETLRRTNLGELKVGSKVNLERAVAGHVRFGGHFVQGHVDTTAEIVSATPDGNAISITFQPADPRVLMYIVVKGYIALDGTSLTITAVDDATFSVMLIAYTQARTVVAMKHVGDKVNVEVDLLGKIVEKQVLGALQGSHDGQGSLIEKIVARVLKK